LGPTDEVKQFDRARKRLKDYPRNTCFREQYTHISAVIETRISRAERQFKQQLKSWEQQHLKSTGDVSTAEDMLANPSTKNLLDKVKYCKTLAKDLRKEK
jgi:hypothetical protein